MFVVFKKAKGIKNPMQKPVNLKTVIVICFTALCFFSVNLISENTASAANPISSQKKEDARGKKSFKYLNLLILFGNIPMVAVLELQHF